MKESSISIYALARASVDADLIGVDLSTSVIAAAMEAKQIKVKENELDRASFARWLENMGYIEQAAIYRHKHGLKQNKPTKQALDSMPRDAFEEIETAVTR